MRLPSITAYIESVYNIGDRLKTLKGIKPLLDKEGMPKFYSARGMVTFMIENKGHVSSIKCFTSVSGYERAKSLMEHKVMLGDIYEDELMVFTEDGKVGYFPLLLSTEETLCHTEENTVEDWTELSPFEVDGLWGYRDGDRVVITPQYQYAGEFSEGRAVVGKDDLYGLIDYNGELIIDTIFDEVSWDSSALAYVDYLGKWGCYDRLGKEVITCKYEWVGEFFNGLLLVKNGGKFGYVNLQGMEVIPIQYSDATSFNEYGFAYVTMHGEQFVINKKGEIE